MRKGLSVMIKAATVLVVLAAVLLVSLVAGRGYLMYRQALDAQPLALKVQQIREQPGFTPLSELPPTYIKAVIAVEDHRFCSHHGVDPLALCRAMWNNLLAGEYVQGGSTITQQLAKNLYFSQEKRMTRKVAELFMSQLMEECLTKREILELYVNAIYFGDGYTGIGQACQGYYGIQPKQMNFDQATMMAGVPNAPSVYAPTQNMELARQRQNQAIRRMEACGYLPKDQGWRALVKAWEG